MSTEDSESTDDYDKKTDPGFPTSKKETQRSVYTLPSTWDAVDGSTGLLFEAEVRLRRDGYGQVQKRELQNAFFRAAVEHLTPREVAMAFEQTREDRAKNGPLLDEE